MENIMTLSIRCIAASLGEMPEGKSIARDHTTWRHPLRTRKGICDEL
jgi:hypothetical protein